MDPFIKILTPSLPLTFNAAVWYAPSVNKSTNCYSYALNCPEAGRRNPGHLSTMRSEIEYKVSITSLREKLMSDGLIEISGHNAFSGEFHTVALRVQPGTDYHFLRLDNNGYWSHKNGHYVSYKDGSGEFIKDPRKAILRGGYSDFGGFFAIPKEGILFRPQVTLSTAEPSLENAK